MIYIKLFYNFLIVGLFSFGGAYSAIPFVMNMVSKFDVLDDNVISNFVAISESTPGSIGVNLATFVGTVVAGFIGAIVATAAEILPAFLIMIFITMHMENFSKIKIVNYVLSVIRPAVIAMIFVTGIYMLYHNLNLFSESFNMIYTHKVYIIAIILLAILIIYKKLCKKSLGTIFVIILGAILGIAINLIM